jgi:nucleoside-diphosphate-sugar epimerase
VEGIISSFRAEGNNLFNLSGDKLITLGDVIKKSAEILSKNPIVKEKDSTKFVQRNLSNLKARESLEWEPKIDLHNGLERIAKYLKLKAE